MWRMESFQNIFDVFGEYAKKIFDLKVYLPNPAFCVNGS